MVLPNYIRIDTLSLHDALPIFAAPAHRHPRLAPDLEGERASDRHRHQRRQVADHRDQAEPEVGHVNVAVLAGGEAVRAAQDRKSTRLNSSHVENSYAVLCLKKK